MEKDRERPGVKRPGLPRPRDSPQGKAKPRRIGVYLKTSFSNFPESGVRKGTVFLIPKGSQPQGRGGGGFRLAGPRYTPWKPTTPKRVAADRLNSPACAPQSRSIQRLGWMLGWRQKQTVFALSTSFLCGSWLNGIFSLGPFYFPRPRCRIFPAFSRCDYAKKNRRRMRLRRRFDQLPYTEVF